MELQPDSTQKQYPTKQMNNRYIGQATDKKQLSYVQNEATGQC